ncbi:hypothetical protein Tcan_01997 [Toxocara canis]|uniref:Uncharacterized protein n=1 Tax=Toxocara canis TaxID=6265 RepID=A0A0B2VK29_TOXCA|nr:hypothetical protein Tcan_01997 [Toxocara canis]
MGSRNKSACGRVPQQVAVCENSWLIEQNEHFETIVKSAQEPTVFICENFVCNVPITSLDDLKSKLLHQ